MSAKRRPRKVTVEADKIAVGDISSSEKRKLSVFERLGPGAPRKYDTPEKVHEHGEAIQCPQGVCYEFVKHGKCQYGSKCRFIHPTRREAAEYRRAHSDDEDSSKETEPDHRGGHSSRVHDSKKDKIKSTVVVTKASAQDESDSDPIPECTDEDLQRRLSQLKQELNRLDQEERERERREKAGLTAISSDESEKEAPPVIVPQKNKKGPGEHLKKKKEKKKKKKKLRKSLDGEDEKMEKKKHHVPFEQDLLKPRVKSPENQKIPEKPKALEKKKSGPMIPRAVRQKVVKHRHSSSSPSKSPSRSPSPSPVKAKKVSPKQYRKGGVGDRHERDSVERRAPRGNTRTDRDAEHRTYSPDVSTDTRRDKGGERSQRGYRDTSPARNRDQERDSGRYTSGKVNVSSEKRTKRSVSPPAYRQPAEKKRPKKLANTRRSISASTSSSSDSSSSRSPVRSKRSMSPRRPHASPHKRSPVKRRGQDDRSRPTGRYGKKQASPVKGGRKGKKVEPSPAKKRSVSDRPTQSRDRNAPTDGARKRKVEEPNRRRETTPPRDARRAETSPGRDTRRTDSPHDKQRRRHSPETDRKSRQVLDEPVDHGDRGDRRKGEAAVTVRVRDAREDQRDGVSKTREEYSADYESRGRSPVVPQVTTSGRPVSPSDRHRTDYAQYRDDYATTGDPDRFTDRDRYDAYNRDQYRRTDERGREVDRAREYPPGANNRERERYDREYDRARYAAYARADDDRLDTRRDYGSYYDDPSRGRLLEDPDRLRADSVRGRTTEERGRDQYGRGYDRYGYAYGYETTGRGELDRAHDASRDISRDRVRDRDWDADRARWDRDHFRDKDIRDDPRLLEVDVARRDTRELLERDLRDLSRDTRDRDGLDERRRVWADDRDTRVEIHPDGHADIRVDVRTDVRADLHVDSRADVRAVTDTREVHVEGRIRDRSGDTRDGRGRTDRDRGADQDIKESGRDHLSRRSEWEQRRDRDPTWSADKLTDGSDTGSRKRAHDNVSGGTQSPINKHRREGSPVGSITSSSSRTLAVERQREHDFKEWKKQREIQLKKQEKEFQKIEEQMKKSMEHDIPKAPPGRGRGSRATDQDSHRLSDRDKKVKGHEAADVTHSVKDKVRSCSLDRGHGKNRDKDKRGLKMETDDKHRDKCSKDSTERDKDKCSKDSTERDKDTRSTSSRDADKDSRDSKTRERDFRDGDKSLDQRTSKERESEKYRSDKTRSRKDHDKERPEKESGKGRIKEEKQDEMSSKSSVTDGSKQTDGKRQRSRSVDSARKRQRKTGHDGEGFSDWSDAEKDTESLEKTHKSERAEVHRVVDERSRRSPSHGSPNSKHSVHEDRRPDERSYIDWDRTHDERSRDDRSRDDRSRDDRSRDERSRDDRLDSDRHSHVESRRVYLDKPSDVREARSVERSIDGRVDRSVDGRYGDRRDDRDYNRPPDPFGRDWAEVDRISDVDLRVREAERDRAGERSERPLDRDRERGADDPLHRADWSESYRDHRYDNYPESYHSYPDRSGADRQGTDRSATLELDPIPDRRDLPIDRHENRSDSRTPAHTFDVKRESRYPDGSTWAPFPGSGTPAADQTDPALTTLPPGDGAAQQPTEDKGDGEMIEYDAISDDDLDDIIGRDGGSENEEQKPQKTGIVDVLDIDWTSLMQQNDPKPVTSSSALKRFTPASIFSKIGVSLQFAGEKLYNKIQTICQKQMDEAIQMESESDQTADIKKEVNDSTEIKKEVNDSTDIPIKPDPDVTEKPTVKSEQPTIPEKPRFTMLNTVAQFHVSRVTKQQERQGLLMDVGPYRRALCARRDLYMRRKLCKLDADCDSLHLFPAQVVDQDLYRQSLQIFRMDRPPSSTANQKLTAE